jgi:hypothetical protein
VTNDRWHQGNVVLLGNGPRFVALLHHRRSRS